MNDFNLAGRYSNETVEAYQKITPEQVEKYFQFTNDFITCLNQKILTSNKPKPKRKNI